MTTTAASRLLLSVLAVGAALTGCAASAGAVAAPTIANSTDTGSTVGTSSSGSPWTSGQPREPSLPYAVTSFGAAVSGGELYVYGGHIGRAHDHSADNLASSFARTSAADPGTWEEFPCPAALQGTALVAHGGTVIVVGGMTARNRSGQPADLHSTADVLRFDGAARAWTRLPSLPEARSSHDAVVVGNTLYVIGGWTLAGSEQTWLHTAWSLDLQAPSAGWRALSSAPFTPRRAMALAAAEGRIFVLGGMTDDAQQTRDVYSLDVRSGVWAAESPLPFDGFGIAAVSRGDDVFASGLGSSVFRLCADHIADGWQNVGDLKAPRFFHEFVAAPDGALLALGGVRDKAHTATIERFVPTPEPLPARAPSTGGSHTSGASPSAGNASARVTLRTAPFPGGAKNRQGVFLQGGALWAFGGNSSTEQHDFAPENFLDEGFRIDLATLAVEKVTPYPVHRQTMQTLVSTDGTTGLASGGFGHSGEEARSWPESYRFDFVARTWTPGPPLPAPRTQFGMVEHGGNAWIFSGMDYDPKRGTDAAFQYPLAVLASSSRGGATFEPAGIDAPQKRRAFGGALIGSKYYMVGGMRERFEPVTDVDVFDFATRTWSKAPAPDRARISPQVVALAGRLYVAAGTSSPSPGADAVPDRRVEMLDPATGRWTTIVPEIPASPSHMRMFAWEGRLLCYGLVVKDGRTWVEITEIAP